MKKKSLFIVLSIFLLVFVDQISKFLIVKYLVNFDNLVIIPKFLSFAFIKNFGAAFGILEGKRVFFIIVTFLVLGYLIYELIKCKKRIELISLIMIISGIIGNFIDRVIFGYVRDFISFSIFAPVFNIADSFIVIGVCIFIISMFVGVKNESK